MDDNGSSPKVGGNQNLGPSTPFPKVMQFTDSLGIKGARRIDTSKEGATTGGMGSQLLPHVIGGDTNESTQSSIETLPIPLDSLDEEGSVIRPWFHGPWVLSFPYPAKDRSPAHVTENTAQPTMAIFLFSKLKEVTATRLTGDRGWGPPSQLFALPCKGEEA